MLTIGLLGGIASGKSTVARLLAERGATVLDADQAAHKVLADDEVQAALRERWGGAVFDPSGELNRSAVAERVFGAGDNPSRERRFLEGLIHPRVRKALREQFVELGGRNGQVAVLDIPLLLEAGWADECDVLLLVDAPTEAREARAAGRGWSPDEFASREAAQTPISQKRARATAVVANTGSPAALADEVERFWKRLIEPRLAGAG